MEAEKNIPSDSVMIVPPQAVKHVWHQVEPLLQPAVDMNDGYLIEDVYVALRTGRHMLWVYGNTDKIHAALTLEVLNYPRTKRVFVIFVGGDKFVDWKEYFPMLHDYAMVVGASSIEGIGRKGFVKALKPDQDLSYFRFDVEQGELS